MTELEVVNAYYAGPLLRSRLDDRLALLILRWLHDEHPKTARRAFAITDGQFAIFPDLRYPSLFFLPCSRRRTLLYLALLFHEFGHLLYALHRPEMDDLVLEFQETAANVFAPTTRRQGASSSQQDAFQAQLVLAYYPWCQEFFCDAVGLHIGGPSYLHAFVNYFRVQGGHAFHIPREKLILKEHPVGWLRVRSLLHRAEKLQYGSLAARLSAEWRETAHHLGIAEDYEGTWSEELFAPLQDMLDNTLEETAPRAARAEETGSTVMDEALSIVGILNAAWVRFEADPTAFAAEESNAISQIENGTIH
jgi:hypothetical protein